MKEITLERLPATVEELAAMPQAALTVPEEVAALTVAALARFPENQEDAVRMLKKYDYPCNITQFKRILKKAVLETEQAYISGETIERILKEEGEFFVETADKQKAEKPASQDFSLNLEQSLDSMNREIVLHVLNLCGGNQTAAAKKLGISRTTLWRYVNR